MDYETEIIDGRKAVVRHLFKPHEIQVGSRWAFADGSKGYVTVEGLNSYGSTDPWYEVVYSWEENGVKKIWQKETFSFQCRYCLIIEDSIMIEAIEVAFYEGKIICAFPTREECKHYIKECFIDVDPFDVTIKTQYISDYKPTRSTGCFDR